MSDLLRLPSPALCFDRRAARLDALAPGNPAGEFLALLARVARGQAAAVRAAPVPAAPLRGGGVPLDARAPPRGEAWRCVLARVVAGAGSPGLPGEAQDALRGLEAAGAERLEALAAAVLAGEVGAGELAAAPFVAAALQAWFSAQAAQLDPAALGAEVAAAAAGAGCPVCGSAPLAGLVQASDRRRWLCCGLCAAEWNLPRVRCACCGRDDDLAYFGTEGDRGVRAEACGRCRAYVKLFDEAHRPGAEPAADDAATLALDLVLAAGGWRRLAPSPYLAAAA